MGSIVDILNYCRRCHLYVLTDWPGRCRICGGKVETEAV
jgi:rRNA maturation protein Nop10